MGGWRFAGIVPVRHRHDRRRLRAHCKRLADVLQQIAVAQPLPFDGGERLAGLAHEAADRVNRGVVAYSGVD